MTGYGPNKPLTPSGFVDTASGGGSGTSFTSIFNSASGQIATAKQNSLGQPLYAVATTGNVGGLGGQTAGLNRTGVGGVNAAGNGTGFNTMGYRRAPAFQTTIDLPPPPKMAAPAMQANLQGVLGRTTALNGKGLQVTMNESTVVLRGTVESERERRLAENVLRLEPGVRQVRNEIQVVPNGSKK